MYKKADIMTFQQEGDYMQEKISCSEQTKRKMALGLKELMETTSFSKITVSDITEKCELHRQTFYYHFQDKFELLNWLIQNELLSNVSKNLSYDTLLETFHSAFETMYESKKFYQNAIKINMNVIVDYISYLSKGIVINVVEEITNKYSLTNNTKNLETISEFFAFGIAGVMISWANKGMIDTPDEMTAKIEEFLKNFTQIFC